MDCEGYGSLRFRALWTTVDTRGPRLEIYGSVGWGFKSSRARQALDQIPTGAGSGERDRIAGLE
jgi:hypothetical protein